MAIRRRSGVAPALSLIALLVAPGAARAGLGHHRGKAGRPPAGYAVPLQGVFQHPAALVNQPTWPAGYASPIQAVPQHPAALVNQPGAADPLGAGHPACCW